MKIEFYFEMADWMVLQKNRMNTSKQFKQTKFFITIMLPAVFVIMLLYDAFNNNFSFIGVVIYGFASLLWVIFYPKWFVKRVYDKTKKSIEEGDNSGILGKHTLILNEEEIINIYSDSEQKIKWSGVKKLNETEDYYFLYTTAISAIVISKEKVRDQLNELDTLIKSKITAS